MKDTLGNIYRVIKVVLGILLFLVGILILAAPVISTVFVVEIAAIVLMAAGAVQLIFGCACGKRAIFPVANIIVAVLNVALGALILSFNRGMIVLLPEFVAVWLTVFGVVRLVEGIMLKKRASSKWQFALGIGVVSLVGAILLVILHWFAAMDIIGILLGIFVIVYGLILLSDGLVKEKVLTETEILREDEEISSEENAAFYAYRQKLHEDDQ